MQLVQSLLLVRIMIRCIVGRCMRYISAAREVFGNCAAWSDCGWGGRELSATSAADMVLGWAVAVDVGRY